MLESIYHKITSPKKVVGIDFNINSDGSKHIVALELELIKNELNINDKQFFNDENELLGSLDKSIPVSINLSGKGVLTKKTNGNSIQQLLPNIKLDEFYIQETTHLVTVTRKDEVDKILQSFKESGVDVIGVSLNGLTIENINSLLDLNQEVNGNLFLYKFDNNEIVDVINAKNLENQTLKLGSENIEIKYLVAYSLAFQNILNVVDNIHINSGDLSLLEDEYLQKQLFKKGGFGALVLVLIVLLINFFIFNTLRDENQQLSTQLGMYEGQIKKIESLKKEVESKNKFLTKTGWLNSSRTSFYADQIGVTVPKSITLTELNINPRDKKESKKQKEDVFITNAIHVSGNCRSSLEINKWIKELKNLDWVEFAEVLTYNQSPEEKHAEFTIEVLIK